MKSRLIASLIVGAAVVLGTTGCNMNTTMATQIPYSPSDGVAVPDSGPVLVRNALFVADESGEDANFVAVLINSTDKTATLHLEIGEGSAKIDESIRVPADTTISLGVDEDPLFIEGLGVKPGADGAGLLPVGRGCRSPGRCPCARRDARLPVVARSLSGRSSHR